MKVLISTENAQHGHYWERLGLARAISTTYGCQLWNLDSISVFDMFDSYQPDIFITQSYNLNESVLNVLKERPEIRVYLKLGDWSDTNNYDLTKYQILTAKEKDIEMVKRLVDICKYPVLGGCHYVQKRLEKTHTNWKKLGIKLQSSLLGADVFAYCNPVVKREFECDFGCVSGFWQYKNIELQKYIFPLLNPKHNYKSRFFGSGDWPCESYCGPISQEEEKNFLHSCKIVLNVHEPQKVYFAETNERGHKSLAAKTLVISDYAEDEATELYPDGEIIFTKSPEEFKEKIDYYLANPDERLKVIEKGYNKVINNYTYFHTINSILSGFSLENKVLDSYEKVKKELKL